MAHDSHSTTPPEVPADMLAERRAGWHAFTRITAAHCVGLAVFLLAMLMLFKVIL